MKWLIVRFSAIGDCVMAAHVPSRIRRAQPDSTIEWAVESRCADVVDTESLCNAKHAIPRDVWRSQRWSPVTWRAAMTYYSRLRTQKFDFGLDLQGHLKTAICLRIAKPNQRLAIQATDALAKRLNPVLPTPAIRPHCVEHALACLAAVADFDADSKPIMPCLRAERAKVLSHVPADAPIAAIAVSAGQWDKAYQAEKWSIIADELSKRGFTVAFIGGPECAAPPSRGAIDFVGRLSLAESCALIAESALVLAGDTGAGHIAAGYETPVVSVFGPTDPAVFRPWTENGIVLRRGNSTENIAPDEVLAAAESLLKQNVEKVPH